MNDVYVLKGQALEAIPSERFGLVPSGRWKTWESLGAYLKTLSLTEEEIHRLADHMMSIGLSALIREESGTRMVGVGIGDNESGLLLLQSQSPQSPKVGSRLLDGREYTIVEEVEPGLFYYETT
ncbi:MAG: hypothetical protein ACREAA_02130 [Candidatus Polarisedimenticolia bacterium]